MKILIACEFSGIVRDAFTRQGHNAWSCDLLQTETPGQHIVGDVRDVLDIRWDMIIAFPPCTHLARSGAQWWRGKQLEQGEALEFFCMLLNAPCGRIAIENPIGRINSTLCDATQIVHPWQFGDPYEKETCLWLKNLPRLQPTRIVEPPPRHVTKSGKTMPAWYNMPDTKNRSRARSRTFPGIAEAMAEQWGTSHLDSYQLVLNL
jgi:hypothetical protein